MYRKLTLEPLLAISIKLLITLILLMNRQLLEECCPRNISIS